MKSIERLFKTGKSRGKGRAAGEVDDWDDAPSTVPSNWTEPPSAEPAKDSRHDRSGATISRFPRSIDEPLTLKRGPLLRAGLADQTRAERIRVLRTELLLRHSSRHHCRAIALVSAAARDGRSMLAAELAIAFAQLGRSTLLLDADFRSPHQHALFGAALTGGLAPALSLGQLPRFFAVDEYPTLSLVTAGNPPPNPIELLSDGRFENLLAQLREDFEFIIVDTPSCSASADAQVIATLVGHVLTIQRAKRSSHKTVRAMLRQLESSRAEVLGAVINHF
jgi:capsular exopolysaccharide synthesis family protein